MHCGQTVGRIKTKLGMQVSLGNGHTVLDGDHAPLPKRGRSPPPNFGPCLLRPNGWMDEAGTWHGGRPQHRRLCVRSGLSHPPPKRGGRRLPNFGPISIVTKRLDASICHCYECEPQPRGLCVRWGPSSPQKRGLPSPIFGPFLLWPYGWMHLGAT